MSPPKDSDHFKLACPMGKFRIFASFHASGASVQIFQGPLAGIFLQRWLDQVQPLLEGNNSRNFGTPDAFFEEIRGGKSRGLAGNAVQ